MGLCSSTETADTDPTSKNARRQRRARRKQSRAAAMAADATADGSLIMDGGEGSVSRRGRPSNPSHTAGGHPPQLSDSDRSAAGRRPDQDRVTAVVVSAGHATRDAGEKHEEQNKAVILNDDDDDDDAGDGDALAEAEADVPCNPLLPPIGADGPSTSSGAASRQTQPPHLEAPTTFAVTTTTTTMAARHGGPTSSSFAASSAAGTLHRPTSDSAHESGVGAASSPGMLPPAAAAHTFQQSIGVMSSPSNFGKASQYAAASEGMPGPARVPHQQPRSSSTEVVPASVPRQSSFPTSAAALEANSRVKDMETNGDRQHRQPPRKTSSTAAAAAMQSPQHEASALPQSAVPFACLDHADGDDGDEDVEVEPRESANNTMQTPEPDPRRPSGRDSPPRVQLPPSGGTTMRSMETPNALASEDDVRRHSSNTKFTFTWTRATTAAGGGQQQQQQLLQPGGPMNHSGGADSDPNVRRSSGRQSSSVPTTARSSPRGGAPTPSSGEDGSLSDLRHGSMMMVDSDGNLPQPPSGLATPSGSLFAGSQFSRTPFGKQPTVNVATVGATAAAMMGMPRVPDNNVDSSPPTLRSGSGTPRERDGSQSSGASSRANSATSPRTSSGGNLAAYGQLTTHHISAQFQHAHGLIHREGFKRRRDLVLMYIKPTTLDRVRNWIDQADHGETVLGQLTNPQSISSTNLRETKRAALHIQFGPPKPYATLLLQIDPTLPEEIVRQFSLRAPPSSAASHATNASRSGSSRLTSHHHRRRRSSVQHHPPGGHTVTTALQQQQQQGPDDDDEDDDEPGIPGGNGDKGGKPATMANIPSAAGPERLRSLPVSPAVLYDDLPAA